MTKRVEKQLSYFKYEGEPVRFGLGTLILIILSVLLIIMATFTELKFTHAYIPMDLFPKWSFYFPDEGINWAGFLKTVKYIPQVPVIFFILGLLDRKFTLITIFVGVCRIPNICNGRGLEIHFPIRSRIYFVLYSCRIFFRNNFTQRLQIL